MARFYARFDGGPVDTLDNVSGFIRRRITATSEGGADLRNGLIASRSLLSADIYGDLDAVNQNGGNGTYFPPNAPIYSTDNSTYVSWSNAYTSTFDGIKTPTTNTYGGGGATNYSKRPTASVTTSDTNMITPASPVDPVGAAYSTYVNASAAVRNVLLSIVTGSAEAPAGGRGSKSTPFARLGQDPSRTLHSIWHDPGLNYFAWDDFTPGSASVVTIFSPGFTCGTPVTVNLGNPTVNTDLTIEVSVSEFEFPARNPNDTMGVVLTLTSCSSDGNFNPVFTYVLDLIGGGYNPSLYGNPFLVGTNTGSNGPVSPRTNTPSTWTYAEANTQISWTIGIAAGDYTIAAQMYLFDELIPAHQGGLFTGPNGYAAGTISTCNTNRFRVQAGELE